FDAGSSDRGARQILDTLRAHGITTTIFLTGQFIERFPEVVREVVADGHEVGNHTYSHPHLTSFARNRRQVTLAAVTKERFHEELTKTAGLFQQVTGTEMAKFWRAPFGEENSEIRGWAAELGYLHVGWTKGPRYNLDSLDWVIDRRSPMYLSPEKLAERLLNFDAANNTTLNGGIILMHLGTDRGEDDALDRALPMMIQRFQQRGFRFVKVSDLKGTRPSAG
ncbi:MAG TPA: polysaccharide deacetylase family protein, partial [Thermoanaerobaculia bacterium]